MITCRGGVPFQNMVKIATAALRARVCHSFRECLRICRVKKNRKSATKQPDPPASHGIWLAGMVFASGAAGLMYQLLWMRQLGLLFGNTSQAAAVTFAAFFAGLGAGSWWWGRRAGGHERPLRLYARLEFGIALGEK